MLVKMDDSKYITHQYIKAGMIERRLYQELLFARAIKGNTLIVAPTALGKTVIAIMLSAKKLSDMPDSKVVVMAPTRPLIIQHAQSFRNLMNLDPESIVILAGNVSPDKREKLWAKARVICATPQTVQNDLLKGNVPLNKISLMVFDEAHHAVGDYAYVFIAEKYSEVPNSHILALTASPGHEREKIDIICENLHIKYVEIKSESDPDVRPYVNPIKIRWIRVDLPEEFKSVKKYLENVLKEKQKWLIENGFLGKTDYILSRKEILALNASLRARLSEENNRSIYTALSEVATMLKVYHALELIQTQGVAPLEHYFRTIESQAKNVKGVKKLLENHSFRNAIAITRYMVKKGIEHPKQKILIDILKKQFEKKPESRVLVFSQFRATVKQLVNLIRSHNISVARFVGQAGQDGLSQKKQAEIIDKFRDGEYSVVVATSVAEEGLDIPSVDLVIFYEPIPSEIRTIQRRGRTGRKTAGKMIGLIAKETIDENFYWASKYREKSMKREIRFISEDKERLDNTDFTGQKTLSDFSETKRKAIIYVDTREVSTSLIKTISQDKQIELIAKKLDVGDFLLSDRIIVERKTAQDFLQSIIDGRLLKQASVMASNYPMAIIILEGRHLYGLRNIHPNAIRGAIVALTIDFGINVIFTESETDTAHYLIRIAKRDQSDSITTHRSKIKKKTDTEIEMMENIISSLPGINIKLSKRLLKHFKTVKNTFSAEKKELLGIEGIGEKLAEKIYTLARKEYLADE